MIRHVTVEQCRLLETRAILADKEQGQQTGGKIFVTFFFSAVLLHAPPYTHVYGVRLSECACSTRKAFYYYMVSMSGLKALKLMCRVAGCGRGV